MKPGRNRPNIKNIIMYKILIGIFLLLAERTVAQTVQPSSTAGDSNTVVIHKDPRIDELVRQQIQINEETTRESRRNIPGFRILVISSPDRNKVFAAKARIYQQFPDLKPYLMYQAPNYKLRVGNFKTQEEAEDYEKELSSLFPTGLYVIRDVIEVKLSDITPNP
jgi:hypothetical protein